MRFRDRTDAGRRLARVLPTVDLHAPVLLGLPRGGVPVASAERVRLVADKPIRVEEPSSFSAVGQFYERFDQTTDDDVLSCSLRPQFGPRS